MKKVIFVLMLLAFTNLYADEPTNVQQGAQEYDWQSCYSAKSNNCLNSCTTSDDTDCQDDCKSMARDKCVSLGFKPPDSLTPD